MVEEKVILAVEFDDSKRIQIRINTKNEALLALALRKAGQAVDYYLEEQEFKKQQQVIQQVPASVLSMLGEN